MSSQSPYAHLGHKDFKESLFAIVGAREYTFSGNLGILGDLPAGKEQVFCTHRSLYRGSMESFIMATPASSTHFT